MTNREARARDETVQLRFTVTEDKMRDVLEAVGLVLAFAFVIWSWPGDRRPNRPWW